MRHFGIQTQECVQEGSSEPKTWQDLGSKWASSLWSDPSPLVIGNAIHWTVILV